MNQTPAAPHSTNILLGITGGIAAYKTADLTRRLKERGADVRIVMTDAAREFITPLTLQAVSGHPVHHSLLDPEAEAGMGHIELARWADIILIAPATADCIARLAHGMANDLLTTVCLASKAQLALAPAMNQAMWSHSITQENCTTLRRHGAHLFGPGIGEQACGDIGAGRMLEPLDLVDQTLRLCKQNDELAGLHVVITAGPTREAIDPVRYISNHSSGKMGYALAAAAAAAGAQVTLISGPVNITPPNGVTCLNVISAREMHEASMLHSKQADIFIASAAVADYRPLSTSEQKMKKQGDSGLSLTLTQNPDIVASVAQQQNKPFTVGFAAETENVVEYAQDKLRRKNLDMIIANNVADSRIGFNSDENAVTVISADKQVSLAQTSKTNLAQQLISLISAQRKNETAR